MQNKVLSLLGLSMKAGKIASGEYAVGKAVKSGRACLVLCSAEASENTRKMFSDMCSFYGTPYAEYGTKEELGRAIGKEFRASLAVLDPYLASSIRQQISGKS